MDLLIVYMIKLSNYNVAEYIWPILYITVYVKEKIFFFYYVDMKGLVELIFYFQGYKADS